MGSDNGNAKTKKSSKRVKFKDEDGSSELSSECSGSGGHSWEGSGSSKDSDTHLEIINRVEGTNSNDLGIDPEIIKGSGNKDEVEIHEGADDAEVIQGEIDVSESTENISLSFSSSSSSTDDQSQADTEILASGNSSSILKQCQNGPADSTPESQLAIVTHESTVTQSPPIQVMDRQVAEFDPSRIPSVVFETSKSTAHMDWSYASNDSLFSIKVGGTSFARDHTLNKKAEELSKGECMALIPSPFVAPMEDTKSFEYDESKETKASDDAVKDKTVLAEEPIAEKSKLANISNHSDKSGIHECSLDLPVDKSQNKNKCAWALCYCSNYSCALCYCWNCSLKRWFCCSDSEDESDAPDKGKAQQKQKQLDKPMSSALKSKLACSCCNCCSWFRSCGRRKCC
ncbi:hypothetical protein HRI_004626300 [Hibiscus trionum]|uniref:Uncharacterized protein n=1 Tax=Hibiscus trionum TaxID=183268 RepID=A0A9W7J7W6_HIBTR|nr:hypothetical protein HRI_004626300 [Hibiscus trionum]